MGNGIIKYLNILKDSFLDIIYYKEEKCVLCDCSVFNDDYLCSECAKKIKTNDECFEIYAYNNKIPIYSSLYYSRYTKEIILKFKYKSDFRCGEILVKYMINTIKNNNIIFDLVTYVPTNEKSLKKRGYNQSKYLAKKIGEYFNVEVKSLILKSNKIKDQIGLNTSQRWNNLKNSFVLKDNINIKNKNVLLIDDVITTGSTAFFCSLELLKAQSKKIIVLTAAKSRI